jgi:hypothetical protein
VHHRLRAVTQLGKGDGSGMRVVIETSDKVPPPALERLSQVPDALLWVLLHRSLLAQTRQGLELAAGNHDLLVSLAPSPRHAPKPFLHGLSGSLHFLNSVDSVAKDRCDIEISSILDSPRDTLGAYFFRRGRIELYWFVIWLIANELKVAVEDLTLVVLVHEMAHLYTHEGQDADGHSWETTAFAETDLHILEGLAQYYTEQVLEGIAKDFTARPLEAFHRLLPRQSEPYRCFRRWAPGHAKRSEVVRQAIVQTRTDQNKDIRQFEKLIRHQSEILATQRQGRLFNLVEQAE